VSLKAVVWNSLGGRYADFWPQLATEVSGGNDVLGLMVNAGWAPWVADTGVRQNGRYVLDQSSAAEAPSWMASPLDRGDEFVKNVLDPGFGGRTAWWTPWAAKKADVKPTGNWSAAGVFLPAPGTGGSASLTCTLGSNLIWQDGRPVQRIAIERGDRLLFSVYLVGLPAWKKAKLDQKLGFVTGAMSGHAPGTAGALVVGGLGIDIAKEATPPAKNGWSWLRTGKATAPGDAETDWGLLFDPGGALGQPAVARLQAASGSDNAVLEYTIPLPAAA
jgi:hypothetical protein